MLCEPKSRIGLLGACYFIGVLVASTIIPFGFLSDKFGRKWLFIITIFILIIAQIGFILATSLDQLYVFMFMFGATFPGRVIVGLNYVYEFMTSTMKEHI